ncbi:hypothetical protein CYMTET_18809 [Cymbomonas tetramitiformis]|uniref:Superoxide dismutase copper/zinc binding domain-containing protein n=1 Tax=Cymbomonas tetramitiformis TaxID=36881 RepID=A0AAE0G7D1_9CHLO|nr:hypothetical protein CYMTET_18809 [Cymbomonas tetramitiformis]|eukprot:gene4918-6000_t
MPRFVALAWCILLAAKPLVRAYADDAADSLKEDIDSVVTHTAGEIASGQSELATSDLTDCPLAADIDAMPGYEGEYVRSIDGFVFVGQDSYLDGITVDYNLTGAQKGVLKADISVYPAYVGDAAHISGAVNITMVNDTGLDIGYNLEGLLANDAGGIHVHEGVHCEFAGDHYYATESDPWTDAPKYSSDASGKASGSFQIETGYVWAENDKRVIVVHDGNGTRIGCGVLERQHFGIHIHSGSSCSDVGEYYDGGPDIENIHEEAAAAGNEYTSGKVDRAWDTCVGGGREEDHGCYYSPNAYGSDAYWFSVLTGKPCGKNSGKPIVITGHDGEYIGCGILSLETYLENSVAIGHLIKSIAHYEADIAITNVTVTIDLMISTTTSTIETTMEETKTTVETTMEETKTTVETTVKDTVGSTVDPDGNLTDYSLDNLYEETEEKVKEEVVEALAPVEEEISEAIAPAESVVSPIKDQADEVKEGTDEIKSQTDAVKDQADAIKGEADATKDKADEIASYLPDEVTQEVKDEVDAAVSPVADQVSEAATPVEEQIAEVEEKGAAVEETVADVEGKVAEVDEALPPDTKRRLLSECADFTSDRLVVLQNAVAALSSYDISAATTECVNGNPLAQLTLMTESKEEGYKVVALVKALVEDGSVTAKASKSPDFAAFLDQSTISVNAYQVYYTSETIERTETDEDEDGDSGSDSENQRVFWVIFFFTLCALIGVAFYVGYLWKKKEDVELINERTHMNSQPHFSYDPKLTDML